MNIQKGEIVYYHNAENHVRRGVVIDISKGSKAIKERISIQDSFNNEIKEIQRSDVRPLTENQKQFVEDAKSDNLEIDYDYSGRFMYGMRCPAVTVKGPASFATDAEVAWDNMGLEYVVYARK